jgi:hypothetical protein
MLRDPEVDIELLGHVLLARGLRFESQLEGRAYDLRPVRPARAGSWLIDVLRSFEDRTGHKAQRFGVSGSDLLILD